MRSSICNLSPKGVHLLGFGVSEADFGVTLLPEMLMVSSDDQLSAGRRRIVSYLTLRFVGYLASQWGVLNMKGALESSWAVVTARGPWIWLIPSRRCNTDSSNMGPG